MSQSSALYIIDIGSLRLIKDQLEEHVSYGLINLTIAILKIKTSYVSSSSSPSQTLPTHSQTQQPNTIDSTSSTQTQVSHTIMTIYIPSAVFLFILVVRVKRENSRISSLVTVDITRNQKPTKLDNFGDLHKSYIGLFTNHVPYFLLDSQKLLV